MNRRPLYAAPVLALALVGCSGSKTAATTSVSQTVTAPSPSTAPQAPSPSTAAPAPTSPAGISQQAAAAQYEQLVAPANAAIDTMNTALANVPASATGPDVAKITDPAAAAIDAVCQALLRAQWPSNTTADIKALVTADEVIVGDLSGVSSQNAFSISTWGTQFDTDAGKSHAASSIVRADLGLAAAS